MTERYQVSDVRLPVELLRAWNRGDIAALEGYRLRDNPFEAGKEREAWDQGWNGIPLRSELENRFVKEDATAERAEDFSGLAPGTGDAA